MKLVFARLLAIALVALLQTLSSGTHAQTTNTAYVYKDGTIFLFKDTVKPADRTAFSALSDGAAVETVKMYDRSLDSSSQTEAFVFTLTYNDKKSAKVRVRKSDYPSKAAARAVGLEYAQLMGRLPAFLRGAVEFIDVMKGDAAWGGNSEERSLSLQVGATSEDYSQRGIREETLIHESCHAFFPDASHESDTAWKNARDADAKFISKYAKDFPGREDFAESFVPYLAVRYRRSRTPEADRKKIQDGIPNRLKYFDGRKFDLYPLVGGTPPPGGGWYRLKTEQQGAGKCLESNQVTAPTASLRASTREGVVFRGASFMDNCQNVSGQAWKFVPGGVVGNYRLKSQFQGDDKCLEVDNRVADAVLGGAAFMARCKAVDSQTWELVPVGDGSNYYKLQNRAQVGMCLEGNRFDWSDKSQQGAAFLSDCGQGKADQHWTYVAAE